MESRKRPAEESVTIGEEKLTIQPLGAGQEVGRSCIYLKYMGKKVLMDCGIHPGRSGYETLPFFDLIEDELKDVDLVLITHFHLDHCGSLPWLLLKTPFKGRCFMTNATKATYRWLLTDYLKVSNAADRLYDQNDLMESMDKIETVNFHQEKEVNGIKFSCYKAGHVLGAAMFMVEIAGVKVLYTGDFSRQEDRHLMSAEIPEVTPDVLIVESTYGTHAHEPREEREKRFTNLVRDTVLRGGRCLIPICALGRAQELLLILDEFWTAQPELQSVPIYYASSLAKKCMEIYRNYAFSMNERIQKRMKISNPFDFKHISYLRSVDHFDDAGPSVVLASPGMLQSGISRQLFESWCTDKKNGVIVAGYCIEGTLAKQILSEPEEIMTMGGQKLPLRCSVDCISFSAHTDYQQTSEFVRAIKPRHIVLVHGEQNEMSRMKAALTKEYADPNGHVLDIYNPRNGQTIELPFKQDRQVRIVGEFSNKINNGEVLSGVIIRENFKCRIMAPADVPKYTSLRPGLITPRISMPFSGTFNQIHRHLLSVCRDVEIIESEPLSAMKVYKNITLTVSPGTIAYQWVHNRLTDTLAESLNQAILSMPQDVPDLPIQS